MKDETLEDRLYTQDKILAELIVRISTIEKLLIDNNVITVEAYQELFSSNMKKVLEVLENDIKNDISNIKVKGVTN